METDAPTPRCWVSFATRAKKRSISRSSKALECSARERAPADEVLDDAESLESVVALSVELVADVVSDECAVSGHLVAGIEIGFGVRSATFEGSPSSSGRSSRRARASRAVKQSLIRSPTHLASLECPKGPLSTGANLDSRYCRCWARSEASSALLPPPPAPAWLPGPRNTADKADLLFSGRG